MKKIALPDAENGDKESSTTRAMLTARNLSIGYRVSRIETKVIAENLNVSLRAGELVCLLGPNGAGKSTLMRTVAGMQPPLGGGVVLDGRDVHRMSARDLAKRLSVVLTERISVGMLTAYALVALGRHPHTNWSGKLTPQDHEVICRSLETVGASDLAARNVAELSDGERQKVMVARALAQEPQAMILDEITAFLDLPRRVEVMQVLRDLAHRNNLAILLSTHDLELALRSADRLWLLPKGGSLHTGAPEDLVLSGVFAEAFAGEGVHFDTETGAFRLHRQARESIGLVGRGVEAFWTERALERHGFNVLRNGQPGGAEARVEIVPDGARTFWQLTIEGESRGYDSLHALTSALKAKTRRGCAPTSRR